MLSIAFRNDTSKQLTIVKIPVLISNYNGKALLPFSCRYYRPKDTCSVAFARKNVQFHDISCFSYKKIWSVIRKYLTLH